MPIKNIISTVVAGMQFIFPMLEAKFCFHLSMCKSRGTPLTSMNSVPNQAGINLV